MRLLLISNSLQHGRGFLDHCADEIVDFLYPLRSVLFVPCALQDWDGYTSRVRERLASLEISVTGIHESPDPRQAVLDAGAIFAGGGNTFRLLSHLYEMSLVRTIRECVADGSCCYLGSSAGTNIACPTIKTTNDMPIICPPSFDALNLVPFNINPHYLDPIPHSTHQGETREQRIREFHEMNSQAVVGLREGTWLRREGSRLVLRGQSPARVFRKGHDPEEHPPGSDLSRLLVPEQV